MHFKVPIRSIIIPILIQLCFSLVVIAQQIAPEDRARFDYDNCEINAAYLDNVAYELTWGAGNEGVVIVIARLGSSELSKELIRRRLHNVRIYLKERGITEERIVAAEGESIEGEGNVELYVTGKLTNALKVKRERDVCVDCCDFPDEKYYPFKKEGKKR
jgi:hypothetical protein